MTKRRDDDDIAAEVGGLSALGAGGLAGARLLGALVDDGPRRSRELGPAPIGSDPWLLAEIRRAISRDAGLDAAHVAVRVEEAIVTLTGSLEPAQAARLERAVRSVQGIKRLVMEPALSDRWAGSARAEWSGRVRRVNGQPIDPDTLAAPRGYSNGMLFPAGGRVLFVAGQIGWDKDGQFVDGLTAQFELALRNILEVVRAAGGGPESIGRLTIYVLDKADYAAKVKEIGRAYRAVLGKHFPAMALVEVAGLLEPRALVEIEATAVV